MIRDRLGDDFAPAGSTPIHGMAGVHPDGGDHPACEECGNHLATLTLDVGDDIPPVELCGVCTLSVLLRRSAFGEKSSASAGS